MRCPIPSHNPASVRYLGVLVVEDSGAALNLGVQHVGIVNAHEDLEVRLDGDLLERVND